MKDKISNFKTVLVPELNLGQLNRIIRSEYLIDTVELNKVEGQPFTPSEIYSKINDLLGS